MGLDLTLALYPLSHPLLEPCPETAPLLMALTSGHAHEDLQRRGPGLLGAPCEV